MTKLASEGCDIVLVLDKHHKCKGQSTMAGSDGTEGVPLVVVEMLGVQCKEADVKNGLS